MRQEVSLPVENTSSFSRKTLLVKALEEVSFRE
jgi:hypothetical protein